MWGITKWGDRPIRKYKDEPGLCSRCDDPRAKGSRYCRSHRNEYQRIARPKYEALSVEQRLRATARAYANVYLRRGRIVRGPCHFCQATTHLEMHHEDYTKPLEIIWLCRDRHDLYHETIKQRPDLAIGAPPGGPAGLSSPRVFSNRDSAHGAYLED